MKKFFARALHRIKAVKRVVECGGIEPHSVPVFKNPFRKWRFYHANAIHLFGWC